jgi:hypothetical protein
MKENEMSEVSKDSGVLTVLAQRLVEQRLPKLLLLKERLDQGEVLTDYDLRFLEEALSDAQENIALVDRNRDVQDIAAQVMHLYKEIMDKAVQNETSGKS